MRSKYPWDIDDDFNIVTELIGGCKKIGDEWILPEGKTLPSQAEIDAKRQELRDDYDSKSYQRARQKNYPAIGDQLDALYHAGVFPADMAAKLKKVKDDNPKG